MATGHRDGKVRIWDIRSRKVSQELSTSSSCQVTSTACASLANTYIFSCTRDGKIAKLDQRMPSEPVRVFEDERFSYAGKNARLSLSTHQKYAAVVCETDKVIVFDLGHQGRNSILETSSKDSSAPLGTRSSPISLVDC